MSKKSRTIYFNVNRIGDDTFQREAISRLLFRSICLHNYGTFYMSIPRLKYREAWQDSPARMKYRLLFCLNHATAPGTYLFRCGDIVYLSRGEQPLISIPSQIWKPNNALSYVAIALMKAYEGVGGFEVMQWLWDMDLEPFMDLIELLAARTPNAFDAFDEACAMWRREVDAHAEACVFLEEGIKSLWPKDT